MLWPDTSMRLALLAPLVAPLRPAQVGGAQVILAELARRLAAGGDDVEVIAAPGSRLPGVTLRPIRGAGPYPQALLHWNDRHHGGWPSLQAGAYLRIAAELRTAGPDVVHAHAHDWPAFYALAAAGLPTVHTLHLGPIDPAVVAAAGAAARTTPRPTFVAVSRALARQWLGIVPVDAVIPHGADPDSIAFSAAPQPDLALVAGRIAPEKGTHLAIAAARRAGLRVLLAGDVYDQAYFDEKVAPLLHSDVEHRGAIPHRRLARLYGRAAVAVVASLWEEPFGMVALEANLAGTPVAGFARGALPEVVGRAGGVLTEDATIRGLTAAINTAIAMNRQSVRTAAVRRHPISTMVDRYRALYAGVAAAARR